jgi:hypothetical protein
MPCPALFPVADSHMLTRKTLPASHGEKIIPDEKADREN